MPFSLSKFIANGVGVSVPTEQLLRSLLITLLVPLFVGKVLHQKVIHIVNICTFSLNDSLLERDIVVLCSVYGLVLDIISSFAAYSQIFEGVTFVSGFLIV